MLVAHALSFLLMSAIPPLTGDTVEVTFRCPGPGIIHEVKIDGSRKGYYVENGQTRDITFTGGGVLAPPIYLNAGTERSGQRIHCKYRASGGQVASYHYTVNRQIVSCGNAASGSIKCKLKN